MNPYVTGTMIKRLREGRQLTQQQLADTMLVSDKAVSKWETGRGYPDVSLIEPLAAALGVSVIELFSGEDVVNTNRSSNMLRTKFYVCPICGNVNGSVGEAVVSCCGIVLPPQEAETPDESHPVRIEYVEDECLVTVDHPMTKTHYISFIAAVGDDSWDVRKLYPEGSAQVRFPRRVLRNLYVFCNRHGLFKLDARAVKARLRESADENNT